MHALVQNLERREQFIGAYTAEQKPANGIDLQGLRNAALFAYAATIAAGSPQGTWSLRIEHSDTDVDGDYVACAAEDVVLGPEGEVALASGGIFAIVSPSNDDTVYGVSYVGSKRYIRIVATPTDSPGSTVIAAWGLGEPAIKPATT